MKYRIGFVLVYLISAVHFNLSAQETKRPKLIVGLVVDQMRWDYLYRFQDRYGEGGFRRLMNEGFNCENTQINYLPTFTAPGHASIYTGSVPALHGITGNDWIDKRTGRRWYCTEDTTVKSIGGGKAGLMSPRNMLASTITDELRLATNFRAKVYGISLKDRGAILPAGHTGNAAFWYDDNSGNFITSSFYASQLPSWLEKFNQRNLTDSLMQINWETLYPIQTYIESTKDNNPYEGAVYGEAEPVFPHQTSLAVKRQDKTAIRVTPFGNTLTRFMAEACIVHEKLGQGSETDFLAVSFSSTDYIGHQYGPNSIEIEDTYLRLDQEIAAFLEFLDVTVGKNQYTIFLTSDHGGAHNAAYLTDHKIPAKSALFKEWLEDLNHSLYLKFRQQNIVSSLMNYQVFLNEPLLMSKVIDRNQVKEEVLKWLANQNGITTAWDLERPPHFMVELLKSRSANGYYANRSGCIQIILDPGWYSGYAATGTTHGSWNPYDAQIPLLWFGAGIKKGKSFRKISMTDISPTLAALLHIQMPNACIGDVIEEVLMEDVP